MTHGAPLHSVPKANGKWQIAARERKRERERGGRALWQVTFRGGRDMAKRSQADRVCLSNSLRTSPPQMTKISNKCLVHVYTLFI